MGQGDLVVSTSALRKSRMEGSIPTVGGLSPTSALFAQSLRVLSVPLDILVSFPVQRHVL